MPAAERTIAIKRPVAAVFDYVADGRNGPSWRSGVLDVEHLSGDGVGAIYRQGVRGPGGRRIAADYEVTAFVPNSRIEFRAIAGPVRPTGSYRFSTTTPDETQLTFALQAELGGLKRLLMSGAVQSTMDAEMGALDRLKAILEG
jgi:uncharacterized membrane protein